MSALAFMFGCVLVLFGMYLGYKMGYEEGHENGYELAKNRYMVVIEGYRKWLGLEDEDGQVGDREEHVPLHEGEADQQG